MYTSYQETAVELIKTPLAEVELRELRELVCCSQELLPGFCGHMAGAQELRLKRVVVLSSASPELLQLLGHSGLEEQNVQDDQATAGSQISGLHRGQVALPCLLDLSPLLVQHGFLEGRVNGNFAP